MWCAKGRLAVAIHHLDISIISRGEGSSVTAAAAYRAGERIVDERTGEVHDYRPRSGVSATEILTPPGAAPWTRGRADLWNRVEQAEFRCDAQLARHTLLALPRELDPATNQRLGREFFLRHFVRRGMVVDLAFHDLDGENPHVHGLSTLRELDGDGFAGRKNRAWNDRQLVFEWREGSATLVNQYLVRANVARDAWVDHRTLEAQRTEALAQCEYERALALCCLPTKHLGKAATAILARGGISTRADYLQEEARGRAAEVTEMRREVELHRKRTARIAAVGSQEGGRALYEGKLDELDSGWRGREEPRAECVDVALTHAQSELARIASARREAAARRLAEEQHQRRARVEAVESQAGGRALYEGKLDELDSGWRGREEPRAECVDAALTHAQSELARIASARRAAAARRLAEEQHQRRARVEAVESQAGGRALYEGKLDELDSGWRGREEPKAECVDAALTHAQSELARIASARRAAAARRLAEEQHQRRARVEAVGSQEGGRALYEGKLDELDSGWRGREEPRAECVDAALTHAQSELARIASARRAAAARRLAEEQHQRRARVEAVESQAGGRALYEGKLDELDSGWRGREEPKAECVDAALTHAQSELARIASARRAAAARRLAEEQHQRRARVEAVESQAGGRALYEGKLDELDSGWRGREEPRAECVDAALTHAQSELARIASARRAAAARRLAEEQHQRRARVEAVESQAGGRALYEGKLDELDSGWRGREEPKAECVDAALTHAQSELARIASARRAASARRLAEEQHQREARVEVVESQAGGRELYEGKEEDAKRRAGRVDALFDVPGCDAALFLALGGQTPNWRQAATSRDVDRALDRAEQSPARWASAVEHELVLDAERTFPGASSLEWRETGDAFRGGDATDNRARAMLGLLSDRARVRAIVVREPNPAPRSLVGRLVTWLRKQVAKLLQTLHLVRRAADAVEAGVRKTQPLHSRPEYWVPAVADETLEPPPGADAFAKAVYGEVRDRYDRLAVAEDIDARFGPSDREASEQRYLAARGKRPRCIRRAMHPV